MTINMQKKATGIMLAALLGAPGVSLAGFRVDGIDTTVGYDDSYFAPVDVPFALEGTTAPLGVSGKFWGGVGQNEDTSIGGLFDIFVMLEVPTEITDLTWISDGRTGGEIDNTSPDWNPTPGSQKYDKITGSEKWQFNFDGKGEIEVHMDDPGDDGVGAGYVVKQTAGGRLLDQSTTLDYNINTWAGGDLKAALALTGGGSVQGTTVKPQSSPTNACADAAATDAEFYACLAANPLTADYRPSQTYEYQIANPYLGDINGGGMGNIANYMYVIDDIQDITALISASLIHASPGKDFGSKFTTPCIDDPTGVCPPSGPGPGPGVPEPSTLALFGLALLGLVWTRRRAPARVTAA